MDSFAPYLEIAVRAARAAGDMLRRDFYRPLGPRGEYDKALADTEAEQLIRDLLLGAESEWGFLGEETGPVPGARDAPVWVVDPNDGTRDYLKGRRGSSVSIALVYGGRPVLGVVHPFAYPDDEGAVYSAAVGRDGVFKNGSPVVASLPERLTDLDIVLVSGGGDRASRANLECAKPARIISIPSIAHRLARVAAGEASATTSLYAPKTWDFAAGHFLVLAAGGAVVDQNGADPPYDDLDSGTMPRLFAGSRAAALELSSRDWDLAFRSERETSMPIARLPKGRAVRDAGLLSRAQGALLGHLVGSAVGSLALRGGEGGRGGTILDMATLQHAAAGRRLVAGQIGLSGELAVASARALIDHASHAKGLKRAYASWIESNPDDPDRALVSSLKGEPLPGSLSASVLVRVTPIAIWAQAADPVIVASKIREDAALTHPLALAGEAATILGITLRALLHGEGPAAALETAHAFARRSSFSREVIEALVGPEEPLRPAPSPEIEPDALGVLHFALYQLSRATSFDRALEAAIQTSASFDALPAIVGAIVGAAVGREGIPAHLRNLVLSTRPVEGVASRPRPSTYWATDAMAMAEALLTSR